MPLHRRIATVTLRVSDIQGALLAVSFPGSWHRTDVGLPADVEFVTAYYLPTTQRVIFTFRHDSFDEVPPGAPVPEFTAFAMSAIGFNSPASDADVACLNRLTAQQIEAAEELEDDTAIYVNGGES